MKDYKDCSDFASLTASLKTIKKEKISVEGKGKFTEILENSNTEPQNDNMPSLDEKNLKEHIDEAVNELTDLFPNSLSLKFHTNAITSLSANTNGTQLVTSCSDGTFAVWDWGKMDHRQLPIKHVNVSETPISRLVLDETGNYGLTITRNPAPLLFDIYSGKVVKEYAKGDKYVLDARKTIGHTDTLTDVCWLDGESFVSCALDGTLRLWSAAGAGRGENERVIVLKKPKNEPNRMAIRPHPTTICRITMAQSLLVGLEDGSVRRVDFGDIMETEETLFTCPDPIISINLLTTDNLHVRTMNSLYHYDLRNPLIYVQKRDNLPCVYESSRVSFLKDKIIVPCSTHKKDPKRGKLHLFDAQDFTKNHQVLDRECIDALFHPKLNQLFLAETDGSLTVLYDPASSKKGIMLPVSLPKPTTKSKDYSAVFDDSTGIIYAPNADEELDLEAIQQPREKQRLKDRLDPARSHRPTPPLNSNQGQGGRVQRGPNAAFMQQVMQHHRTIPREQDPREALLAVEERSRKDPKFVAPAYKDTQPEPVFDYEALAAREAKKPRK